MKNIILLLVTLASVLPAMAFRGGGGGGFRGGGMSVGVGVGSAGMGPRGNVSAGVAVSGSRGSVAAYRSAPVSAHYHAYSPTYWGGWYGYAPYHYYYPAVAYTQVNVEVEADDTKSYDVGTVVPDLPSKCKSEKFKGKTYKRCGVNWFEPQFSGTEIEYVVVEPTSL